MKKIFSLFLLLGMVSTGAIAAPSYLTRDANGGYVVTYDYTDKAKTGWYLTGRAELSFLNWENKYDSDYLGVLSEFESDKFSFEPVFGGNLSVGHKFGYFWRGEIEVGYIGRFVDKDAGIEFSLSAPYALVNGYYDFTNGVYLGLGVGAAMPITKYDSDIFLSGGRTEEGISPMAGVMLGFSYKLDDNFVLDLRYRLSGFNGTKQTRHFQYKNTGDPTIYGAYIENDIGLILDNSISIGLRYEF